MFHNWKLAWLKHMKKYIAEKNESLWCNSSFYVTFIYIRSMPVTIIINFYSFNAALTHSRSVKLEQCSHFRDYIVLYCVVLSGSKKNLYEWVRLFVYIIIFHSHISTSVFDFKSLFFRPQFSLNPLEISTHNHQPLLQLYTTNKNIQLDGLKLHL